MELLGHEVAETIERWTRELRGVIHWRVVLSGGGLLHWMLVVWGHHWVGLTAETRGFNMGSTRVSGVGINDWLLTWWLGHVVRMMVGLLVVVHLVIVSVVGRKVLGMRWNPLCSIIISITMNSGGSRWSPVFFQRRWEFWVQIIRSVH